MLFSCLMLQQYEHMPELLFISVDSKVRSLAHRPSFDPSLYRMSLELEQGTKWVGHGSLRSQF